MAGVNAQYNVAAPDSLSQRIAGFQRRRMYGRFVAECRPGPGDTIVDVGATSDRSYDHSNYLEAWYPHKDKITAVGIDDAAFLEQLYPGVVFRRADARALPFADGAFDFAHSSAVLEHVGSRDSQAKMLSELWRVSRKGIFATTPNRWFPVEFHSSLPLVHWLPAPTFRAVLRAVKLPELAEETNLNLMSRADLERAAREAGLENVQVRFARLGGWGSNLLLIARKR
jgi:ubiquinone/menaquinone biosynthesis C-methylase UbiE